MARVLVVGDDPTLVELEQQSLVRAGCLADVTVSVPEAMKRLKAVQYDYVVVDRLGDGNAVAQSIESYQRSQLAPPEVLAPGAAAFRLERYLNPIFRRVRYLTDVVVNAMEYRAIAARCSVP